jgi:hypothetical protein
MMYTSFGMRTWQFGEKFSCGTIFYERPVRKARSMRILSIDVGYRNLAICLLEDGQVVEWEVIDAIKEDGGSTPLPKRGNDPIIIGLVTKSLWARQEKLLSADIVVIEKQPLRARVMRVLEGAIVAFFHTCRLAVPTCKVAKIDSFSARDKFEEYEHRLELKGKTKYAARKKASAQLCTEYLKASGQESELFQKAKKRDDLADALMQGVMYMNRHELPFESQYAPSTSSACVSMEDGDD